MAGYLALKTTCLDAQPRMNLGERWASADGEDRFADAFVDAYAGKSPWLHNRSPRLNRIMAREVPMNGFGIADLVVVSWEGPHHKRASLDALAETSATVRAFEFKLSDWKKGLMQAHRYRFFADVAILVVPTAKLTLAQTVMDTFRALEVGLWGFNEATGAITPVYTPRPRLPARRNYKAGAVGKVLFAATQDRPSP